MVMHIIYFVKRNRPESRILCAAILVCSGCMVILSLLITWHLLTEPIQIHRSPGKIWDYEYYIGVK